MSNNSLAYAGTELFWILYKMSLVFFIRWLDQVVSVDISKKSFRFPLNTVAQYSISSNSLEKYMLFFSLRMTLKKISLDEA